MDSVRIIPLDGGYKLIIEYDDFAECPQDKHADDSVFIACPRNRHLEPTIPRAAGSTIDDIDRDVYEEYPLYAYIHSGIVLSTGPFTCPWDSGRIGSVFVKRADAWKDSAEIAADWVKYWNGYLAGERYGYILVTPDGDEVDSCWGYDDLQYAIDEGKSSHQYRMKNDAKNEQMTAC